MLFLFNISMLRFLYLLYLLLIYQSAHKCDISLIRELFNFYCYYSVGYIFTLIYYLKSAPTPKLSSGIV